MAYTSRQQQIEQVVTKAMLYNNIEEHEFTRCLQYAYDCVRELSRDVLQNTVVYAKKTPNSIDRIDFPTDMEEFIGVGVPLGGKLWLLTEDKDIIATYTEDAQGNLSLDANDGEGVNLVTNQYENFRAQGGININGYFKIDWKEEQIIINSNTRTELILVYVTSGILTDQIQYVDTKITQAMISYILWKYELGNMKTPAQIPLVQMREKEWKEERQRLKKREMFSMVEFRDHWNRTKSLLRR